MPLSLPAKVISSITGYTIGSLDIQRAPAFVLFTAGVDPRRIFFEDGEQNKMTPFFSSIIKGGYAKPIPSHVRSETFNNVQYFSVAYALSKVPKSPTKSKSTRSVSSSDQHALKEKIRTFVGELINGNGMVDEEIHDSSGAFFGLILLQTVSNRSKGGSKFCERLITALNNQIGVKFRSAHETDQLLPNKFNWLLSSYYAIQNDSD